MQRLNRRALKGLAFFDALSQFKAASLSAKLPYYAQTNQFANASDHGLTRREASLLTVWRMRRVRASRSTASTGLILKFARPWINPALCYTIIVTWKFLGYHLYRWAAHDVAGMIELRFLRRRGGGGALQRGSIQGRVIGRTPNSAVGFLSVPLTSRAGDALYLIWSARRLLTVLISPPLFSFHEYRVAAFDSRPIAGDKLERWTVPFSSG